ncbi:carboxy terminal-processing peptidase [uncultured Olleya sp.]|uniref:carboxy terminal-processing peptidase n=1 Tax=uncultured Olleya sp. TaxID=757243 RepID=UPI002593549C|nr:carboxy terminal-processing peptidase [uncultured Olleya sp.]
MYKPLLLLITLFFNVSLAQNDSIFCQQLVAVKQLVADNHYQPKAINDSLSQAVFDLFITNLDNDKDFFLQSDIAQFKTQQLQFDEYLNTDNCLFIDSFKTVLAQRIKNTKTILESLNTKKPDYSGGLIMQYLPEKEYTYAKNLDALALNIEKVVALKVLKDVLNTNQDIQYIKDNFETLEVKSRLDIVKNQLCVLEEFTTNSGGLDRYVKDAFINAFLQYHDPHSVFFNPTEKLIYEGELSSNQLSFGITTEKNKEGQITIAQITPGSAAFINGNFEVDDIIISLTANGTTFNTLCVSNDAIKAFSNKEGHKTIAFTIKKKNGTIQTISITKTKIKVEDNAIRGYLIGSDQDLGYIKIPSFYTNDESLNGRGVSSDFAKELYKLQKQQIQGLLIDLRFNGGGSMQEAIELIGMLIDRGPVTIIETNQKETYTIRDVKRGTFFNKPIAVLVNSYSASASEFFASAMQDYNRALIVGSTTHGKSSAQGILPLDIENNLGFCKITVETFYRVTGQSHQSIGVIPDIKLPSIYDNLNSQEQYYSYALKNHSVTPTLKHNPLAKLDYNYVINNHKQRLKSDSTFTNIANGNIKLKQSIYNKGKKYTLTIDDVLKNQNNKTALYNQVFQEQTNQTLITVNNTKPTQQLLDKNPDDNRLNQDVILQLSKDVYIAESYNILKDLIKISQ